MDIKYPCLGYLALLVWNREEGERLIWPKVPSDG